MLADVGCDPALLTIPESGQLTVVAWNHGLRPVTLPQGEVVEMLEPIRSHQVVSVEQWEARESLQDNDAQFEVEGSVNSFSVVAGLTQERKHRLCQTLRIEDTPLTWDQRDALMGLVLKYHDVFS